MLHEATATPGPPDASSTNAAASSTPANVMEDDTSTPANIMEDDTQPLEEMRAVIEHEV